MGLNLPNTRCLTSIAIGGTKSTRRMSLRVAFDQQMPPRAPYIAPHHVFSSIHLKTVSSPLMMKSSREWREQLYQIPMYIMRALVFPYHPISLFAIPNSHTLFIIALPNYGSDASMPNPLWPLTNRLIHIQNARQVSCAAMRGGV